MNTKENFNLRKGCILQKFPQNILKYSQFYQEKKAIYVASVFETPIFSNDHKNTRVQSSRETS